MFAILNFQKKLQKSLFLARKVFILKLDWQVAKTCTQKIKLAGLTCFLLLNLVLQEKMSRKDGKLEQERFADSVAELNERIARERDEESAFLLQNQENEDFQGMSKNNFF